MGPMRGSRNFRQGGPGQSGKKTSDNVVCFFLFVFFVLFFLSSAYFTEVKWLISKKTFLVQGSRGGPTFSKAKEHTFRGLRNFLSGIWGDQCIIFRDQGSSDPLGTSYIRKT